MNKLLKHVLLAMQIAFLVAAFVTLTCAQEADNTPAAEEGQDADPGWPRVIQTDDVTVTIYQPQIEVFQDDRLEANAAVSVETKDSQQPTYGVIKITAHTEIDKEKRLVYLTDIEIPEANFPGAPAKQNEYLAIIRDHGEESRTISLDRVEANLAITKAENSQAKSVDVNNDPPRIFFSTTPALLVLVDGDPVLRQMEGTGLQRIINTRALILFSEKSGRYYLPLMDRWLTAKSLEETWTEESNPPPDLNSIKKMFADDTTQQVDLLDNPGDDVTALLNRGSLPAIYVSTTPAELLLTQGKPQMQPISGTKLLYMKNTDRDIFLYLTTQQYYVILSGRWYNSKSMEGPWEFVTADNLPKDFTKIPETHPKGKVLASVATTPEAKEAVIANSIPQTAEVSRTEATLEPLYDGDPKFEPIEETGMEYAVNTPTPVICLDPQTYYSVENGVWFVSHSPRGSWMVATSVPPVIYTIPPRSRIHYVTYVKIYRYTPDIVYVGYTPGYLGTCVTNYGVVVYGTGWRYRPWIGSVWLGAPPTWGTWRDVRMASAPRVEFWIQLGTPGSLAAVGRPDGLGVGKAAHGSQ